MSPAALQARQPVDMWTRARARVIRDCRQRARSKAQARQIARIGTSPTVPALLRVQAE